MWQAFLDWYFAPRQLHAAGELPGLFRQLFSPDGLKRAGALLAVIFEIFGVVLFDTPRTPRGPELDLTGYHVVLEDHFDGDGLDLELWAHRGLGKSSAGRIYDEGQARVEGGKLILKAQYREDGPRGTGWYNSMIRTVEEYTYGYFEITCMASMHGAAWWLNSNGMSGGDAGEALSQGGVNGSEVDIFEAYNYDKPLKKNSVGINVHVDGYGKELKSQQLGNWRVDNLYTEMNTFGLLWTEEEYIFYVNGIEAVRSAFKNGVSRAPEYAIISLAIPMDMDLGYTTEFFIDSVRILQREA